MRPVPFSLYLLPARPPRRTPYVSSWRMSPEQAAGLGAIEPVGEPEWREVPETDEERQRAQTNYPSAGYDSVQPPRS